MTKYNEEELAHLISCYAHDIRNHLTAIGGFANVIQRRGTSMKLDELIGYNNRICTISQEAEGVIEDLMTIASKRPIKMDEIYINDVVEKYVRNWHHTESHPLKIILSSQKKIQGNSGQLYRGDDNIVKNAKDALPHGGPITLSTVDDIYQKKMHSILSITDDGQGMDENTKKEIFNKIYYTTKKTGNGIGLYSVKRILDSHNANIEFHSKPGKGTQFDLYFPVIK